MIVDTDESMLGWCAWIKWV